MSTMTGTITSISSDGKRFQIDGGDWYGCFASNMLKATRGDHVTFHYKDVEKNGRIWKNVQGVVTSNGQAPQQGTVSETTASSSTSNKSGGYVQMLPVLLARERAIIRQNALTAAVAFHNKDDADEDTIVATARVFEAYTSGDGDIEAAKKSLHDDALDGAD